MASLECISQGIRMQEAEWGSGDPTMSELLSKINECGSYSKLSTHKVNANRP